MWNKSVLAFALLSSVFSLTGCERVSFKQYEQLRTGQNRAEVEAILGKADTCDSALIGSVCLWGDEKRNITITFVDDRVAFYTGKDLR